MLPAVNEAAIHSVWSAARPLIADVKTEKPQSISRAFDCFDHKKLDNLEGLVTIIGGKATTLRAMAEKTTDLICQKIGREIACRTKTSKLLHYRMFYKS